MSAHINKVRDKWNDTAEEWNCFRSDEVIAKIIDNPLSIFRPELRDIFKISVKDFSNKRVLVPASGDNRAVFAFRLLGANVTSLDISNKQLEYSERVAKEHNWDIEFICDDVMSLGKIQSDTYDFVYISNGVMVWINDLASMYKNINRVLKTGGHYVMYDIHPFMFPVDNNNTARIVAARDYNSMEPVGSPSVYRWRIQDILNAMVSSGLKLKHIEEMHAEYGTFWVDEDKAAQTSEQELTRLYSSANPLYALPQAISICAVK